MLSSAFSKHCLYDLANVETVRKKLKEGINKVVQKYREIRVHQARLQIKADKRDEKEVVNMRLKRKEKVQRKNYVAVMKQLKRQSYYILEQHI